MDEFRGITAADEAKWIVDDNNNVNGTVTRTLEITDNQNSWNIGQEKEHILNKSGGEEELFFSKRFKPEYVDDYMENVNAWLKKYRNGTALGIVCPGVSIPRLVTGVQTEDEVEIQINKTAKRIASIDLGEQTRIAHTFVSPSQKVIHQHIGDTEQRETLDSHDMTPHTLEAPNVKPQTLEAQTVKPQTLEAQNVKPQTLEAQDVKPQTLEAPNVNPQTLEAQNVKLQALEAQNLKPQTPKSPNSNRQTTAKAKTQEEATDYESEGKKISEVGILTYKISNDMSETAIYADASKTTTEYTAAERNPAAKTDLKDHIFDAQGNVVQTLDDPSVYPVYKQRQTL